MLKITLSGKGCDTICGAPEGHDAMVLAGIAAQYGSVIHVAMDEARLERLAQALVFFSPETKVIKFPGWDCLPYDRVSPSPDLMSRRASALSEILSTGNDYKKPCVIISTVSSLMQRVPPREIFANASFKTQAGAMLNREQLQAFLEANGYNRTQTVREPGEYVFRGDIIDIFPSGLAEPIRIDCFGDKVEKMRNFDPATQCTTSDKASLDLHPVSEIFLNEASIHHFRAEYRRIFGTVTEEDPLYAAVSSGHRYAGMEHWMPLFYPKMERIYDYVPAAAITYDAHASDFYKQREEQINDFYQTRLAMQNVDKAAQNPIYHPIPPSLLYVEAKEWDMAMANRKQAVLLPFAPTEGEVDAGGRRGQDFSEARTNPNINLFEAVIKKISELISSKKMVAIAGYTTGSSERLGAILAEHGMKKTAPCQNLSELRNLPKGYIGIILLGIEHGFVSPDLAVLSEQDILGERLIRGARKKRRSENFIAEVSSIDPGDLVVHSEHGIGRFEGLETIDVGGAAHDCLKLTYEGGDRLYVPVENIDTLSRYGAGEAAAHLDKLGSVAWQNRKARIKKRIMDIADDLIKTAAQRELRKADIIEAPEGAYNEFAARFPYPETEDQATAINDTLEGLTTGKPMDRLICGDVGFGKTEVALRAAFVTAMSGKQVAVVVPTTLLARQHMRTFRERFAGFPLHIGQLSRLVSATEVKHTKQGLKEGKVDIVIGTHAILGKNIEFKNLGLVIVDEEQHFGVKQKERLKELRNDVHVLTLTATPIPRTLQLALSGVRELSLITTPPIDRMAVRTFVLPYDPVVIREAITRERYRGGQVFYVCPHIEDLGKVMGQLRELVPEAKIAMAHGRMPSQTIEEVMGAFDEGKYEILVSTNIIESGLDIPNANTLIVHHSDLFGLAQLYQLRGRVGRSKARGYAYLTYQQNRILSETAQRRLHVIEMLDTLGAGFQLASHDMDIRGAGNLLGEEQSGHIREVGAELYQQMLEDAINAAKVGKIAETVPVETWVPQINLGTAVLIPNEYIQDLHVRLAFYKRLAEVVDQGEIDALAAEMVDRFGKMPPEVSNLVDIVAIKQLCRKAGVEKVDAGPKGAVITFHKDALGDPQPLIDYITRHPQRLSLRPDYKLVVATDWHNEGERIAEVKKLLGELKKIVGVHQAST